ncbi:hypothetical protein [Leeia oryzae]|uniref:hypothetical protein n=1 Tax=Leeia oryzae TaxID=356662 RepID=UPI00037E3EE0|nr:hypothetical protein [Leeia oryzae]
MLSWVLLIGGLLILAKIVHGLSRMWRYARLLEARRLRQMKHAGDDEENLAALLHETHSHLISEVLIAEELRHKPYLTRTQATRLAVYHLHHPNHHHFHHF